MRKRRLRLTAKIPNYVADGVAWKRAIYDAVSDAKRRAKIRYLPNDKLDVEVRFHLEGHRLTKLDLDNRLKQVGDALQGFINDKGAGGLEPIIPNDNQIYRLVAEKRLPAKRDLDALSTITFVVILATLVLSLTRAKLVNTHRRGRTNRWTRAAGACFVTNLVRRRVL